MARQLHRFGLKVIGYEIAHGRDCLSQLKVTDERRYILEDEVIIHVATNQGTLHVVTAPGFIFDGRSGPKIVDWYTPNLGTLEERLCWLVHDCNGYGMDLSFKDTNLLLYVMLRDMAKYRNSKASVVEFAVSLSKSWYGPPKPDDWCHANVGKVRTVWIPKEA